MVISAMSQQEQGGQVALLSRWSGKAILGRWCFSLRRHLTSWRNECVSCDKKVEKKEPTRERFGERVSRQREQNLNGRDGNEFSEDQDRARSECLEAEERQGEWQEVRSQRQAEAKVVVLGRTDSKPRQGGGGRHVSPIDPAVLRTQSPRFGFLLFEGGMLHSS